MYSNLSLKDHITELWVHLGSIQAVRNQSFDEVRRSLPREIMITPSVTNRGKSKDVYVIVNYKGLRINLEFTTDGRTFNVYPGSITYLNNNIPFKYLSTRCSLATPLDLESETKLAKIISKLIEVY